MKAIRDMRQIPESIRKEIAQQEKVAQQRFKELRQEYKSKPEVQRRDAMSKDDRGRDAMQRVARNIKTLETEGRGNDVSYESCERQAREIAERVNRKRG